MFISSQSVIFRSLALFCFGALSSAAAASAQELKVASQVPGIEITSASELPRNPTPIAAADLCIYTGDGPETAAGKSAAAADWAVLSEITQGDLTFVGFVGKTTPGTSGSCLLENGNIGIFRGDQLLALAYAAPGNARGIGALTALEPEGMRVWDGDYLSMPLGDLHVHPGDLALLRPVSEHTSFCQGRAEVPDLFGLPINLARILLLNEGWKPAPVAAADRAAWSGFVSALADAGIEEVQDCSGTGFGYCSFSYSHENGATLGVTTAGEGLNGEGPRVASFGASCD